MKIFATSDIHGQKKIIDKLSVIAPDVDLILVCGDIGGKNIAGKTFPQISACQKKDAHYLTTVLSKLRTPSRFILGNDDWFEYEDCRYLQEPQVFESTLFIPFEFVLHTPFNTNREVNENKLCYELSKLKADNNSIIVAHTPPFMAGDRLYNGNCCGSRSVRAWIEDVQPKIWFCGHIHEDNSVSQIGETLVFNCACQQSNVLRGWCVDTDTLQFDRISI